MNDKQAITPESESDTAGLHSSPVPCYTSDYFSLYQQGCMEGMKQYPDKYFDLAIVDPPYGIGMDGNAGKSNTYRKKAWDVQAPNLLYFIELQRISKNCIIWGANHFIEHFPLNMASSPCWIVWDKREGFIPPRTYADCELAFTTFRQPARIFRHYWDGFLQKVKEHRQHPTQKPVKLYEWLLKNYAKEGDKILDTHLGSGSSVIACYNLDYHITGYETDEDYFTAMKHRIEEHMKQQRLFDAN